MTSDEISRILESASDYSTIYIPEFTWGGLRIDAISIDLRHRWIRGFEIKVNRSDFNSDSKFALYTQFCSSLSIVCPENLIGPEEIDKPFGLLWVIDNQWKRLQWKKRPKNFQKRNSLSWIWTYIHVLELEFPRIHGEFVRTKNDLRTLQEFYRKRNLKP